AGFDYTVSDGSLTSSAHVTITVTSTGINHPPSLANPGNKTVNEGSLLSFALVGSDPDGGQTLTYSIFSGSQTGMVLNASSGAFSWTPSEAQGPGTYSVTFRVTDNGSPIMFASRTITITVNEVNVSPTLNNPGN